MALRGLQKQLASFVGILLAGGRELQECAGKTKADASHGMSPCSCSQATTDP